MTGNNVSAAGQASLEIRQGPVDPRIIELGTELSIGRGSVCMLPLNDPDVSRRHAEFRKERNFFTVVDLGSVNGTFVNGMRIHRFVPRPLYDGDEIVVGSVRMIFHAQGNEPIARRQTRADRRDRILRGVSVVMTGAERKPVSVSATLDASMPELSGGVRDIPLDGNAVTLRRLQAMVHVSSSLGAGTKTGELLDRIMENIFDLFPRADRSFIMRYDKYSGEMIPAAACRRGITEDDGTEDVPVSRTVLATIIDKRQSILCEDTQSDERFSGQRSIVDLAIRSMMVVPFLCKDEILGVIGVDTVAANRSFTADDLAVLTGIAAQAAIALKNAELFETVEQETRMRTHLSRYLSPDVVEGVLDGTIPLSLGGEKKNGTVLFGDIVGFTALAERMSAVDTIGNLNRLFALATRAVTECNGTLHKFGGDMLMAFWNVLYPDCAAEANAIRAGLRIQTALWLLNLQFGREGLKPVYIGIGCNTGEFAGGNIGGIERMEYTVIGGNVNLAQRIESLAGRWQVLVSEKTYTAAHGHLTAVGLPPAAVKGKSESVKVYSVRGIADENGTDMLLVIPVFVRVSDDNLSLPAIITGCRRSTDGGLELELAAGLDMEAEESVDLQLNCVEFGTGKRLQAAVRSRERTALGDNSAYLAFVLTDIQGDDKVLGLFSPGNLVESNLSWEAMARR